MIKNIPVGKVTLGRTPFLPPLLVPLLSAASDGRPLEPPLQEICAKLGFNSFMFGMCASPHLDHESQIYAFTTLPTAWLVRYDLKDYVEVDPRILKTRDSKIPLVWDAASERGRDPKTDFFLDDAAAHGIGSGFACELNDVKYCRGIMALNSRATILSSERRSAIGRNLGAILLLGSYFHEIFRKGVLDLGGAPQARDAPLSARQRQCLEMAARGLTNEDIAYKLGISPRTAQFHFDCIRSKLNAANRQEAVAKAMASGLIRASSFSNLSNS